MKYQFCIRFRNTIVNSAANKAYSDCNTIFSRHGYKDYTFTVYDNAKRLPYYFLLLKEIGKFFFSIKRRALVGIQYPLLSINNVFKHFVKAARLKGVRFFCIVHDLESLRTGGNPQLVAQEINNLSAYDFVIVHNVKMMQWLAEQGLNTPMIPLYLFDYIADEGKKAKISEHGREIAFAGNLGKSRFIYALDAVSSWRFNLFGPHFEHDKKANNVQWLGEFAPESIPENLAGRFGLIWDGDSTNKCTGELGAYLAYNNSHKFSLYIAAGLPVIAPAFSAIAHIIKLYGVGILVHSLKDLENMHVSQDDYTVLRANCNKLAQHVISGSFFGTAIEQVERQLQSNTSKKKAKKEGKSK